MEKLMDPMLNVASSGLRAGTTCALCAGVISAVPPVVTQTITLLLALIPAAISLYTAGSVVGLAVFGSLPWIWTEAAPAFAARTASAMICCGVNGRYGVCTGRGIFPVSAAGIINFFIF